MNLDDELSELLYEAEGNRKLPKPKTGAFVVWRNGLPYPEFGEPHTPETMLGLIKATARLPYEPQLDPTTQQIPPDEQKFVGMDMLEVANYKRAQRAATGSLEDLKSIEDRVIGKPKQQIESVQINATLQEWLEALPDPTPKEIAEVTVIPAIEVDPLAGL